MKILICFSVIIISFISNACREENKLKPKDVIVTPSERLSGSEELKLYNAVLNKGDSVAYHELISQYMDERALGSLFLSLIMAEKYNYTPANYEVYRVFMLSYSPYNEEKPRIKVEQIGKSNYNLAMSYLKKGANLGDWQCIETINELYPELKEK